MPPKTFTGTLRFEVTIDTSDEEEQQEQSPSVTSAEGGSVGVYQGPQQPEQD